MNTITREIEELVRIALMEDVGSGDITTSLLVDKHLKGRARVIAKEMLVVAGLQPFCKVFQSLNPDILIDTHKDDGSVAQPGDIVAELQGPYHGLLTGERTALNFLQHLSGIATQTYHFVEQIKPYPAVLLDTRKTTPGWRLPEKEAVRLGGGTNHRLGLFDAILIKENHIAAAGGIGPAIKQVKRQKDLHLSIEIEVTDLAQFSEALHAAPDMILLDNMSLEEMRQAVAQARGRIPLEASGNISLHNIHEIAATGVQYISVGALTHSARAVDLSMIIKPL